MSIQNTAIQAYTKSLDNFNQTQETLQINKSTASPVTSFASTLEDSLTKVNEMQEGKNDMIKQFASGQNQNVHELMISIQKAGLAVNLTSAVRNKVMEAYKELTRIQF